jgi:tetratricopeptide (TPR) repeat protein
MPQQKLDNALEQLVVAELIFRRGAPPDAEYTFKHALVQDAAYSTLLRSRRQQIHGRIVTTLESQFPETVTAQPQVLAHHCTEAGLAEKAIGYRLQAGRQAVIRSAMPEAVAQFQKGLDVVNLLPPDARREERELDLLVALSPALIAAKAYSSSEVGEMLSRSRVLADRLGRSKDLVSLLYGQWGFYNNRSKHAEALSCALQIEEIGRAQNDHFLVLMGQMYEATVHQTLGEFLAARALLEQCLGMRDPGHRTAFGGITAEDPYVMTLSWLGVNLAVLGDIEQGRACIAEALSAAQQLENAHSRVYSRCFALVFATGPDLMAGLFQTAKGYADELMALSDERGFSYLSALGAVNAGAALTALGQYREGLALLTKGLDSQRMMGASIANSTHLVWRGRAYGGLGQIRLALGSLAEAESMIEATGARSAEAEIQRTRGDLLLATGDPAAAERSYQRALAVSRRQSSRLYELRSAMGLAGLWQRQGNVREAGELLASIYARFTEGFDTPVLQAAKAQLDQLEGR